MTARATLHPDVDAKVTEVWNHEYEECFHDVMRSRLVRRKCRLADARWRYVPLAFHALEPAWGVWDRLERRYVDEDIREMSLDQLRARILD